MTVAPYPVVLAVKKIKDPDNYSLERFLEILGRGPQAVTEREVEIAYRALKMVGFGD